MRNPTDKTCPQDATDRRGRRVLRRKPHDAGGPTRDPNNGYAPCIHCGRIVYVGTGIHPNLGCRIEDAEPEAAQRRGWGE